MAHLVAPADTKFDGHFAAIGRLVDTWAQLEFKIDQAIWDLAGTEQMFGACITAQLIGVNNRLRALRALAKARGSSSKTLDAIGTFAGSLGGLQQKRHRAAHDPRMVHVATGELDRLQITADNSLVFGFQPESKEVLLKIQSEIAAKVNEFIALHQKIADELNSLPEASRPQLVKIVPTKTGV